MFKSIICSTYDIRDTSDHTHLKFQKAHNQHREFQRIWRRNAINWQLKVWKNLVIIYTIKRKGVGMEKKNI